jgi:hypothetical protein
MVSHASFYYIPTAPSSYCNSGAEWGLDSIISIDFVYRTWRIYRKTAVTRTVPYRQALKMSDTVTVTALPSPYNHRIVYGRHRIRLRLTSLKPKRQELQAPL